MQLAQTAIASRPPMLAARITFVAIALLCGVLGIYLAVGSRGEAALQRAQTDVSAERSADALAEIEGLQGEIGARAAAIRGYAFRHMGRLPAARTAFQTAARRDPNNWVLQRDYAGVLLRLGERAKARARMSRAKALNPRMRLPRGFVGPG